jgi:hypothetical protein
MTHDEWVQAAVDAAVEQGFSVAIEDEATLVVLAELLSHSRSADPTNDTP